MLTFSKTITVLLAGIFIVGCASQRPPGAENKEVVEIVEIDGEELAEDEKTPESRIAKWSVWKGLKNIPGLKYRFRKAQTEVINGRRVEFRFIQFLNVTKDYRYFEHRQTSGPPAVGPLPRPSWTGVNVLSPEARSLAYHFPLANRSGGKFKIHIRRWKKKKQD